MSDSILKTPLKCSYHDPDHYVFKLKYENWEKFTELIVSHITRLLDLSGVQLEILRGENENSSLKDGSNKLNLSSKKSWNPLKKKDSKSGSLLSEENLSQIQQLADFIGNHLKTEGLFRKPGNCIRQGQLVTALGTGVCINFEKSQFQAHDAASVLKSNLGQLQEPLLLPSKHFNAHSQIAKLVKFDEKGENVVDKWKRIEALQLLLLLLPTANRKVVRGIFDLLYQTAKHQEHNKMNAANLSAMFTPHLLWPRHVKANEIHESIAELNGHIAFMIRHSQKIFLAPTYIRDAAKLFFSGDNATGTMSPQVSTSVLVAPSSAVKRTASARLKFTDKSETESAISDLFAQVNSMPNSAKKKKMVKNFSKHQEVLKYQNKGRKRNRTFSGMLRKKTLAQVTSSQKKDKPTFEHFAQPGEGLGSPTFKSAPRKLPKPDLIKDCHGDTVSLGAEIKEGETKAVSHVSLPGRITRGCKNEPKSPRLAAFAKLLHQRKSSSPVVKGAKPLKEKNSVFVKPAKVSTV